MFDKNRQGKILLKTTDLRSGRGTRRTMLSKPSVLKLPCFSGEIQNRFSELDQTSKIK